MNDGANVDVVVVGGGPAGLSVVRFCVELALSCVLFDDRERLGGQLLDINHPIRDYLGVPARSGSALASAFARHASLSPARLCVAERVVKIDVKRRTVETARGRVCAGSLLLAMGARPRALGVRGERERTDRRDRCGLPEGIVAGSRVVVIGGGDNAAEVALHAAERGAAVTVLARGDLRATPARQLALRSHPRIQVMLRAPVASLEAAGVVIAGGEESVAADRVLVRIGYTPNSELVRGQLDCDAEGYIETDGAGLTARAGVAALGDVVNGPRRASIATAVGQAMVATKALFCGAEPPQAAARRCPTNAASAPDPAGRVRGVMPTRAVR
jgi:thioredoxin reductase (NADPH)